MIYFTPGPSQLYPTVKHHLLTALDKDIPSISHRSEQFRTIVKETYEGLMALLGVPKEYSIFFVSSGTEAMERILQNCVDQASYHLVNGPFSKRFYDTALELGKQAKALSVDTGQGFTFSEVQPQKDAEMICITHNETGAGTAVSLKELYKLKKQYPDLLFSVDIVSSAPYVDLDYSLMDCVFFSVQKGFGLPAGLGVLIISPKALKKALKRAKDTQTTGSYHSFAAMVDQAQKYQTVETPNVLAIYLLNKVIQDMLKQGIQSIRNETEEKAELLYEFFDHHNELRPFVHNKLFRSKTVVMIHTPSGSKAILQRLKVKGFVVGAGYGTFKESAIRIANFPAHTIDDIKTLLAAF